MSADGKTFHIASTPEGLASVTGFTVPGYSTSKCGDTAARGAVPYFFGRRITLLTVFQDRLVIVANGVVFLSRTGDYFNWFRDSAISVSFSCRAAITELSSITAVMLLSFRNLIAAPMSAADASFAVMRRFNSLATSACNRALVSLYWQVGRDILDLEQQGLRAMMIDRPARDLWADADAYCNRCHAQFQPCHAPM
uniref:Uncharacterized protein n=1 Tax=Ralstonia syzygii R24 TaxID=907261 RepID=G3A7U3_9RALS|nr:hypothetical protein RALSY_40806 [Ralstonia syzygii R24]